MSNPLTVPMLTGQKIPVLMNATFTYLGAGNKRRMMNDWLDLMAGIKKYVDPTAGSCSQPFAIAETYGIPVQTNDASYYSYAIAVGYFERDAETNLPKLAHTLVDAEALPKHGILSEICPVALPEELCVYIDGLLSLVPDRFRFADAHYIRACVGKTLLALYTMRGIDWCLRKDGRDTHGDIPNIQSFASMVYRYAGQLNDRMIGGKAMFGDARTFLPTADLKDATVSFDPAWPFSAARGNPKNPYAFYHDLGSILAQRIIPIVDFWRDTAPKKVAEEFRGWVDTCFKGGAVEVYIWNQTSNDPSEELLTDVLRAHYDCERIIYLEKRRISGKKIFADYVLKAVRKGKGGN